MIRDHLTRWHNNPGVRSGADLTVGECASSEGNPVLAPNEGPDG